LAIVEQTRIQPGVSAIFRQRGRTVVRSKKADDLPKGLDPSNSIDFGNRLYPELKSRSFRRYLISKLNRVRKGSEATGKTPMSARFEQKARDLGLFESIDESLFTGGELLEWFVANCFQREFFCPSYWGVTVEGLPNDYDVIVYRGTEIGYIECKSGQLGGMSDSQICEFLKREIALSPAFSVFLADDVSRDRLNTIGEKFLVQKNLYAYEVPGMMDTGIDLDVERYKNFIRVIPINCFIVPGDRKLTTVFDEVFQFLTVVCDRPMPFENIEAKKGFQ
jgi:hypothetical protein